MKLLGTEPARWAGVLGALLVAVAAFANPWVSPGAAAAAVVFITMCVQAYTTRPFMPSLLTGVVSAAVALVAEYGYNATEAQVAGITGAVLAVASLFIVQPQVTPKPTLISLPTGNAVPGDSSVRMAA
jgi:chromate transport protein ChrA